MTNNIETIDYKPFWVENTTDNKTWLLILPVWEEVQANDISKMVLKLDRDEEYFTIARYTKEQFLEKTHLDIPEMCTHVLVRIFQKDSDENFVAMRVPREEHDGEKFLLIRCSSMTKEEFDTMKKNLDDEEQKNLN